jgi:hypothetical protein
LLSDLLRDEPRFRDLRRRMGLASQLATSPDSVGEATGSGCSVDHANSGMYAGRATVCAAVSDVAVRAAMVGAAGAAMVGAPGVATPSGTVCVVYHWSRM